MEMILDTSRVHLSEYTMRIRETELGGRYHRDFHLDLAYISVTRSVTVLLFYGAPWPASFEF
jgi:hypothetical protein